MKDCVNGINLRHENANELWIKNPATFHDLLALGESLRQKISGRTAKLLQGLRGHSKEK